MRLSDFEKQAISAAARSELPQGARVSLFGSRRDDARRGGDLDLLVELPAGCSADAAVRLRSRLAARLFRDIDERRIDMVLCTLGEPDSRAIVAVARRDALELART
jgi:predicted nucleotidyltransferase